MMRPARPVFAFGPGAAVGTGRALIGLGAGFRPPALVGAVGLAARAAVAVNLGRRFVALAAPRPFRATAVPPDGIAPHRPAVPEMLAGSMPAAWIGADRLLGRLIPTLLMAPGPVLCPIPRQEVTSGPGANADRAGARPVAPAVPSLRHRRARRG
jgi:hypothetical protein